MNALDNLLLIAFVAFLIFWCYKKKRFPFSMLRKKGTETTENTAMTAGMGNIVPMPVNMGAFSQMYPFGIPAGINTCATHCRVVGMDNTVFDADSDLEHMLNVELIKLSASGCIINNVNAVAFELADGTDTMHIAFVITYSIQQ